MDVAPSAVELPPFSGTALYALVCTMNHSCAPNVKVVFPSGTHDASVVALKDIPPGQELCVSYIDESLPFEERTTSLRHYGFVCDCEKCATRT